MNIVILDGFVLNPGDLGWDDLKTLGNCRIHDRTSATEVVERSAGAEIVGRAYACVVASGWITRRSYALLVYPFTPGVFQATFFTENTCVEGKDREKI